MASSSESSSARGKSANQEPLPFEADQITAPLKLIFSDDRSEQKGACEAILSLLTQAWATPVVGRELAYALCDRIREAKGVERLVTLCTCSDVAVQLAGIGALEQCLTPANRHLLVRLELDQFINTVRKCGQEDFRMVKASLGVLESLFKQSANTCNRLIEIGALDAILYTCRSSDEKIQRHCAAALANCAMYGTAQTQRNMIQHDAAEWLFRLAFSGDSSVQYYACLAISVLASNKDIEAAVRPSGTLELIAPFVASHEPGEFARSDTAHCQGRSPDWLRRLVPVLSARNKAAQCLAAFHFAMEADIKKQQGNLQVFQQIGAVGPLQNVAMRGCRHSRQLAKSALLLMGHELPKHLSSELLTWKAEDIGQWLLDIGLSQYAQVFTISVMDGEMLSSLSDDDMREELEISNRLHRRKLLREIVRLRSFADYDKHDTDGIGQWLCDVGQEMARYRGAFLDCGVTRSMLNHLTNEDLNMTIGMKNALHRRKLLLAIQRQFGPYCPPIPEQTTTLAAVEQSPTPLPDDNLPFSVGIAASEQYDGGVGTGLVEPLASVGMATPASSPPLDVFISYRRSTGSQLASLLKVHLRLKLRNFNIFLDVDELGAGKFDEALLDHIANAKNFIIVLSPHSLDRCHGDHYIQDWVHKEVHKAVVSKRNIIPVLDEQFEWPDSDKLPESIRSVTQFNGVAWSHMYQDAAIDKIVQFMEVDAPVTPIQAALPATLELLRQQQPVDESAKSGSASTLTSSSSSLYRRSSSTGDRPVRATLASVKLLSTPSVPCAQVGMATPLSMPTEYVAMGTQANSPNTSVTMVTSPGSTAACSAMGTSRSMSACHIATPPLHRSRHPLLPGQRQTDTQQ